MQEQGVHTISPVDGTRYVTRPFATDLEIEAAMTNARMARKYWCALHLDERIERVREAIDRLLARQDEYSLDLVWQIGRPIAHAPGEFSGVLQRSNYMLSIAGDSLAAEVRTDDKSSRFEIRREPLGTVLAITPWNYPYLTATNIIVPALAAGNTVILKPSPQAPLVGEHFMACIEDAGLPSGVFQCLHLSPDQIPILIRDPRIDHVAFTGSVANGLSVENAASGRFMGVGLELGGKDAAYVRQDADVEFTVDNLVDGAYFNAGQSCCAVERIYVQEKKYADFVDAFVEKTRNFKLGDPLKAETSLGPVISQIAADRIRNDIADAVSHGAEALLGDKLFEAARPNTLYLAPQILTNVTHDMKIMSEETFGPVVGIMPVVDDVDALRLINDSQYGLTASIWTSDEDIALDLSEQIETGTVFLNRCDSLEPSLAWSGVKQSGRGCTLSRLGFDALTRPKSLNFNRLVK